MPHAKSTNHICFFAEARRRQKTNSNDFQAGSHTKDADALRAHPANLRDAAGRGRICPKQFSLKSQKIPNYSNAWSCQTAIITQKNKHPTTKKRTAKR